MVVKVENHHKTVVKLLETQVVILLTSMEQVDLSQYLQMNLKTMVQ